MKGRQYTRRGLWFVALMSVTFVTSSLPNRVLAQGGNSLRLAEDAYSQVDFDSTLRHVNQAIEEGNYERDQLARIYELKAMCAAALDQYEVAHTAYMRMLALDPEAEVPETLSPDIRSVFLEAMGSWSARGGRLESEVTLVRNRGDIRVDLSDPLNMGRTIVLHYRLADETNYTEVLEPAAERVYFEILGSGEADYVEVILRIVDEHDNNIIEMGDEDEPLRVGERPPQPQMPFQAATPEERPLVRRAWFWAVIGTTLLVAAGGGVLGWYLWDRSNTINAETEVTIGVR